MNLRSDVGFKAVFADRNNKDILIGVLNQILPPDGLLYTSLEKLTNYCVYLTYEI